MENCAYIRKNPGYAPGKRRLSLVKCFLVAMIYAYISQECGSEKSMTVLIESVNECLKNTVSFIINNFMPKLELRHPESN